MSLNNSQVLVEKQFALSLAASCFSLFSPPQPISHYLSQCCQIPEPPGSSPPSAVPAGARSAAGPSWRRAEPGAGRAPAALPCPVAERHVELRGTRVTAPSAGWWRGKPCLVLQVSCTPQVGSLHGCHRHHGSSWVLEGKEGLCSAPQVCACTGAPSSPATADLSCILFFCPGTFLPPVCSWRSPALPPAHSPPQPSPQFAPWRRCILQGERRVSLFLPALSQTPLSLSPRLLPALGSRRILLSAATESAGSQRSALDSPVLPPLSLLSALWPLQAPVLSSAARLLSAGRAAPLSPLPLGCLLAFFTLQCNNPFSTRHALPKPACCAAFRSWESLGERRGKGRSEGPGSHPGSPVCISSSNAKPLTCSAEVSCSMSCTTHACPMLRVQGSHASALPRGWQGCCEG